MSTKIAWADETLNPFPGCRKISPGCLNCYAEKMAMRLASMGQEKYKFVVDEHGWNGRVSDYRGDFLKIPRWKKPRRIFVNSMGDLFWDWVTDEQRADVFMIAAEHPRHKFLILTKRAEAMKDWIGLTNPLKNVWLGITAEDQTRLNERGPHLAWLHRAGWKTFVSVEPMLSEVSFDPFAARYFWTNSDDGPVWRGPDQVFFGCESGPGRRRISDDIIRMGIESCRKAFVPVFVKQIQVEGRVSHDPQEWPKDLRVREMAI